MDAGLLELEVAAYDAAWRARWPESRPIGYELRDTERSTGVRFHSLPESKRYAGTPGEYDELLARHFTLLSELCSLVETSTTDLRVVTVAWATADESICREAELTKAFPTCSYWMAMPGEEDDGDWEPVWTHAYVGATTIDAPDLRALLLLVADDVTSGVIISPPGAEWLYHPYDGGADVIAPDPSVRDALRLRHAEWLPTSAKGL